MAESIEGAFANCSACHMPLHRDEAHDTIGWHVRHRNRSDCLRALRADRDRLAAELTEANHGKDCMRSHPHEHMTPWCDAHTRIAKAENRVAHLAAEIARLRERLVYAVNEAAYEAHSMGRIYGTDAISHEELASIVTMIEHKIRAALGEEGK